MTLLVISLAVLILLIAFLLLVPSLVEESPLEGNQLYTSAGGVGF